jgi:hypothetical protein
MSWRKILSVFCACSGLFFGASIFFSSTEQLPLSISAGQSALVVLGVVGVANSIPLWLGRAWALWVLRVIAGLVCVAIAALSVADYLASDRAVDGLSLLGQVAFYASLLSVPGFFVAVLFQPSVVAEFNSSVALPPNNGLHRTAVSRNEG